MFTCHLQLIKYLELCILLQFNNRITICFLNFTYFLLKDNCFTEFCCLLSNLNMNQPQVYIYPLPFGTSLPSPSPSHPSRLIQSSCLSFLSYTANSHWLSILHMVMYVSMLLSPYNPASPSSPPLCVHKSVLNVYVSIASLCIISSVPSLQIPYICVSI